MDIIFLAGYMWEVFLSYPLLERIGVDEPTEAGAEDSRRFDVSKSTAITSTSHAVDMWKK